MERSRPSAVDVLTGLVGRGGRVGVTIVNIGSRFYDDAVDRVLESDELWRIVYRISHSPEVTSAITSSSSNSPSVVPAPRS